MKASLSGVWTYFKLYQSIYWCVLGAGVVCMLLLGVGSLMKVVFNLVKCCRDQAFDIYMDGMA